MLVCPDCGNSQFTQRRPAEVELTVEVTDEHYVNEVDSNIVDVERDDDKLTCTDCFGDWYDEDLITEERYNDDE